MTSWLKTLWSNLRKSKERLYIDGVEKDLRNVRAERIRLLHARALAEAALEANASKERVLAESIAPMYDVLGKS